ncbi:hypothetical protein RB195_012166 [Necator americanus]|uniref:Uncharacterized protein n=1 Tax=Necator americanus TaxID=51031 RepID=A0ABR1D5V5_NECAM
MRCVVGYCFSSDRCTCSGGWFPHLLEAHKGYCITLLSSLLPSGSCLYPLPESLCRRHSTSPLSSPEYEEKPSAPTALTILSSAEEVVANCAASSDVEVEHDDHDHEQLPPPEQEERQESTVLEPEPVEEIEQICTVLSTLFTIPPQRFYVCSSD